MTSREKFEAWYLENFGFMEDDHETLFERSPDSDGEKYYRLGVRIAHESWQASESASQQKLTDMAVQLANAESKCRELAAENAHARERHIFIRALAVSILEHSGGRMDWRGAMEDATELLQTVDSVYAKTPATDAFLAEVRAQGVEMFAERKNNEMMSLHPDTHAVGSIAAEMSSQVKQLREFAAQLRKGGEL